jgi:hypothetical protein
MKQDKYLFMNTTQSDETAILVLDCLQHFISGVKSCIDLGCGLGSWSHSLLKHGIERVDMIDHPSLDKSLLKLNEKLNFYPVDLDKDLPPSSFYDLAVCIEVLEHFEESRAKVILEFLVKQADLILFSAAIPGQNGIGHINCKRHAYWHKLFKQHGFDFYDGVKPKLMKNELINFWIRQNLFFYYKPNQSWRFEGLSNITTEEFEIIHRNILNKTPGIKEYLKLAPQVFLKRFRK